MLYPSISEAWNIVISLHATYDAVIKAEGGWIAKKVRRHVHMFACHMSALDMKSAMTQGFAIGELSTMFKAGGMLLNYNLNVFADFICTVLQHPPVLLCFSGLNNTLM